MKNIILLVALLAASYAKANSSFSAYIESVTDSGFGGTYLKIEKLMKDFDLSRFEAHEVQNQMRDELEINSGSFSKIVQKPYLEKAFSNALDAVKNRKSYQSGFKPVKFKAGEFVVVLDMDETLLTHWYKKANQMGTKRKGSLFLTVRDSVVRSVDRKTGDSLKKASLLLSSNTVQLRPDVVNFFDKVSKLEGFKGFVLYTAKEDKSAWDLYQVWKNSSPELFKNVLGFFTRNYLLFNSSVKKPSKDLRIFDPSLQHVVLIDDNESRVLQKYLNFRIPKFNADGYLDSIEAKSDDFTNLHSNVLNFTYDRLKECAGKTRQGAFSLCIQNQLGDLSNKGKHTEQALYFKWLVDQGMIKKITFDQVIDKHTFHQDFVFDMKRDLATPFPVFKKGIMQL